MSDLQLALIALGALVVVSVILYNWWQERRLMRESETHFNAREDDALMEEFRLDDAPVPPDEEAFSIDDEPMPTLVDTYDAGQVQPVPDTEPDSMIHADTAAALEVEPAMPQQAEMEAEAEAEMDFPAEPEVSVPAVAETLPDEVNASVDLIGAASLRTPMTSDLAIQALRNVSRPNKPVQCFLQAEDGEWHPMDDVPTDTPVLRAVCALQLADRNGPASQPVIGKFKADVENLATALDAVLEWRGHDNPVAYAAELDQFCVAVDVMVGFHLIQGDGGTFAGTKLRGLAEAGGMQLHTDGAFHFENDAGQTLFTMVSQDQRPFRPETLRTIFYRGLSFQLDVPRAQNCVEAFNQMALFARNLETSLSGHLVDDNQRPLGDAEMDKIRQQLKTLQARMESHGIIAGSVTALRLFS